jgi:hypothetical protein
MSPAINRFSFLRALGMIMAFALVVPSSPAESFTLTDKQGRSLKADVLSVNAGQVKIKRDDGQTFDLPLAALSDADQEKLKEWAAKSLPPGALQVEMSRAKFDTNKTDKDVKLTTGETVKDGMTITEEKWGYAVTVSNRTPQPIGKLRAEYRLFATVDSVHVKEKQGLKKKAFETAIETVPELGKITFRTETISAIKTKYNGNIVSAKTGDTSSRETLVGVWMRIYREDALVYEAAMPDSLRMTEKW